MKTKEITGSARRIGYQLGELGRLAYHQQVRATGLWGKINALKSSAVATRMQQAVRQQFPAIWQELEGLAEGLQAPLDEVFAWNCRGDLLPSTSDGCTTVMGFTAEGLPLIAHNEDGFPQLKDHCLLVTVRPDAGMSFTSFYYPGSLCGHTFAVNASGLVITVNNIRAQQRPEGFPRQILARASLDAKSVDDAIAVLTQYPRSGAFHHTLGQCADKRIVSVEATGTGYSVLELSQPYGHANHLISSAMAGVAQVITGSSESRQNRLNRWLAERDIDSLSPQQALDILNDQTDMALPVLRRDPHDPDEENTLATAIFVLAASGVSWQIFTDNRATPALNGNLAAVI